MLQDLLALIITESLRTSWSSSVWCSPVYTWGALSSNLIVQTCWPFTGLRLQEMMLSDNAVFISQRGRLWDLEVAAPSVAFSVAAEAASVAQSVVLMYRRVLTSIISLTLLLAAVVARVQWLTLLIWEQVQVWVLLLYASWAPRIATAITETLIATLKRTSSWSSLWLLTSLATCCTLERVQGHWI